MLGVTVGRDASGNIKLSCAACLLKRNLCPCGIKVTFDYNPIYVERVRTIPGRKWHPEEKYWTFPFSKQILEQVVSAFAGQKVEIDPSLKMLASQVSADKTARTMILERFRDLIRLKHYSVKTEETTFWRQITTSGQFRNSWAIKTCPRR